MIYLEMVNVYLGRSYSPKLADFVPSLWYGRQGAGQYGREGQANRPSAMKTMQKQIDVQIRIALR